MNDVERAFKDEVGSCLANYHLDRIDFERHSALVILAVLHHGSWEQWLALFRFYGRKRVGDVFRAGCRKMHLERNATWGFAFGDRCFGPFCDSLREDFFGNRSLPVTIRNYWGLMFCPGVPVPELADRMEYWRPTRRIGVDN